MAFFVFANVGKGPSRPGLLPIKVSTARVLNFKSHISIKLRKAYTKHCALKRIRRFVPSNIMLRLCKSFIQPHIKYCSPLFFVVFRRLGVAKLNCVGGLVRGNAFLI